MELKAVLKQVNPVIERGNFKSRKVWLTTEADSKYPQTIEVEFQQDKIDLLEGQATGTELNLHLNLRGREWTNPEGKTSVFNSLVCWKVDGITATAKPATQAQPLSTAPVMVQDLNDLPF